MKKQFLIVINKKLTKIKATSLMQALGIAKELNRKVINENQSNTSP